MLKLLIINSGSSANAALVINGNDALLIDCGVSYRALRRTLDERGFNESIIRAVFITHSHSDHIKGLESLHKALNVGFYSAVDIGLCNKMNGDVSVSGFMVSAFECAHDVPCAGYKITCGNERVSFATDTGIVTDSAKSAFEGCGTVVLESNHDIEMLRCGPYPQILKQRILSEHGHLSNKDCAAEITRLASRGALRRVVLAHLSEQNNTPLLAKKTTLESLSRYGFDDIDVITASPSLLIDVL